eukprot:gene31239-35262_t
MSSRHERPLDAGVTLVELEMPKLAELNGAVGFPVALYEANDDMAAYLAKYDTGIDLKQLAAGIASPDVKGTFDGLVLPRKLPAANGTVDARPAYDHAMRVARPALQKLYRDTFTKHRLDALVFPTVPQVALNWLTTRPTVSSVIIGARNEEQLRQNLGAVGWSLTTQQIARLDKASVVTAPYPHFPYHRQEGFARLNPPAV